MKTLKHLFFDGLAEIYDAETRLVGIMPQMGAAATCTRLQTAILSHSHEIERHIVKLEGVFRSLGERASRKTSEVTIALWHEGNDVMCRFKGFPVINAALIAALQKIEHFQIAYYGCLRDWAVLLGAKEAALIFQEIIDQDKATNETLTDLAHAHSNRQALLDSFPDDNGCDIRGNSATKPAPKGLMRSHLQTI